MLTVPRLLQCFYFFTSLLITSFEYFVSFPHFFIFILWIFNVIVIYGKLFEFRVTLFALSLFSSPSWWMMGVRYQVFFPLKQFSVIFYIYFQPALRLLNPNFLSVNPAFLWIISSSYPNITAKCTIFLLAGVNPPDLLWATGRPLKYYFLSSLMAAGRDASCLRLMGGMGRHHCQIAVVS